MRAVITRGKYKGFVCEVSQWCNDWFTLDPRDNPELSEEAKMEIMRKPFSPSSLAFTYAGLQEIRSHKNNGMLFAWFEPTMTKVINTGDSTGTAYMWSFKKRKI